MLRYKRINSQFFTDTLFVTKKGKSSKGNTCAQLFVSDKGYVAIYPMERKGDYVKALHLFCKEIGVMDLKINHLRIWLYNFMEYIKGDINTFPPYNNFVCIIIKIK